MRSQPSKPASRTANRHDGFLPLKPLAQAIALMLLAGGAQAEPAFSAAWFAAKGAAQASGATRPTTPAPGTPPPLAQQQRVQERLGRSFANMNNTVAAIAAAQAAQAAGRAAASSGPQTIHNGLGGNGLNVVIGPDGKPLFVNAEGPVQTDANGKVLVSIKQTADKAILNWETFNVGRDTTVAFQQDASWALMNKVNNSTAPSQIQGQIKGDGTVMILNGNGVVFSGSSQVNVRNLVAAATDFSDEQFKTGGLYSGSNPAFTNAQGAIRVEQGAQLNTAAPATSTAGGGYVLLLGKEVDNAGTIATPKGQALLAAGDSFTIRKGYGTDGSPTSTTRGNEVTVGGTGTVTNSGVILAASGDVTLAGNQVRQNGAAMASTSADARGTVHLTATGANGSVTLGEGSTTAILLDASATALDSQRDALIAPAVTLDGKVIPGDTFRRDLSLVQIDSSGTVDFQKGSITLATGGQVAVNAGQRSLVRDGAVIDVSGATGVKVAMESNSVKVNLQGNEQRDSSVNRDGGGLNNNDIWVDVRDLVFVPAGTNGYATDRWYTAGGLLEVSGYLGTQGHSVAEWMAQGGTVSFTGNEVVTQAGSQINLSGGTLDVQAGTIKQTWLKGADGRLYELSSAPGDILYTGLYKGYEDHSQRWGQTDYYYTPLIAPNERKEGGYTVGRDAGTLVIGTRNAVLEGTLASDTYQGERQTRGAQAGLDGYSQSQKAVARGAQLVVGSYTPWYVKSSGTLEYALGADANTLKNVILGEGGTRIADGLDLGSALPAGRQGTLYLDSAQLNGFNLGAVKVAASEGIRVDGDLQVAPAGSVTLYGPKVEVNADITAHGGSIQLGNVLNQITANGKADTTLAGAASVKVAEGVKLDASGLWSNQLLDPNDSRALPYLNGGSISLRSSGSTLLGSGSLVDVSSGAALLANGKLQGGKGGNVTLAANAGSGTGDSGVLSLGGDLRGQGVKGGGTLALQAGKVLISDSATSADAGTLLLRGDFFDKGFSAYEVEGNRGLEVAEGTRVDVSMPVYRQGDGAISLATGGAPRDALETWTPPVYLEDAAKGVLTQRQGASLSLQAGSDRTSAANISATELLIGKGSVLNVDPGQSIKLASVGRVTVDGTLNAWGGSIAINSVAPGVVAAAQMSMGTYRPIWIGDHAVLDAAARAATAVDSRGNHYGFVRNGGSIVIGGEIDHAKGDTTGAGSFVVVSQGARLDASGTQAVLDIVGMGATPVASHGGSIAFSGANGLYLDGQFKASAGGAGAAGGSLSVALGSSVYANNSSLPDSQRKESELILGQYKQGPELPAGVSPDQGAPLLEFGHARLAVDQVEQGGFDNLSLMSSGLLSFDGSLDLTMANALNLYAGAYGLAEVAAGNSTVNLHGNSVRFAASAEVTGVITGTTSTAIQGGVSQQAAAGRLNLSADGLLDIRDLVKVGAWGNLVMSDGSIRTVDRRGFADMQLRSHGDMRLLSTRSDNGAQLSTPGTLGLVAAQIYPGTGVKGAVRASRIDIGRIGTNAPAVPYSAFGELRLQADVINQGGVLRAPLGNLILGYSGTPTTPASTVNLLPGSLTSVSGAGLVIPYGGTVDGKTWLYDGVSLSNDLLKEGQSLMPGKVDLVGQVINVEQGAVVDVSGGGELVGAGFVSGRGGSTDARFSPLMQYGADGFLLPALSSNPVYAIVPGVQAGYAPQGGKGGAVDPRVGQQITIGAGVPGLPAGTYTLLPSTYALLPGAFRVEVNGLAGQGGAITTQAMRNGSWSTAGTLGLASGARDSLASQVIITSADMLRRYSQYNETSFSQFLLADAARLGIPAALMPRDAKAFNLSFANNTTDQPSFSFAGELLKARGEGGRGSTSSITQTSTGNLEIVKAGRGPTAGFNGVTLTDESLNAIGAGSLNIGAYARSFYGQGGNFIQFDDGASSSGGSVARTANLVLRSGAILKAPEVFLVTAGPTGGITVEQGASIDTLGQGAAPRDSRDGYIYKPGRNSVLAVSNGYLNMLAPDAANPQEPQKAPGSIRIGVCDGICSGTTGLYSEGTIGTATDNAFELGEAVNYGTRNLTLAVGGINVGSAEALADLAARNLLPSGLTLNQQVLDRLLRGDTSTGAPALETLVLGARDSLNFFGNASLDTYGADGKSRLKELVLTTPALYGKGEAGETARIHTSNLIWNGAHNEAGSIITGGAGTGAGNLVIDAERIEFGYQPDAQPTAATIRDRLAVGFANVNLNASERVTANHKGGLSVYQRQDGYVTGKGFQYSGGNLTISTPVMTGGAGSVNRITAGGDIRVSAPNGSAVPSIGGDALGAELSLSGRNLLLEGAVVLPSGKLSLKAEAQLSLTDAARIDLAGRKVTFNDVNKYSWGGDLILESRNGDIRQAAGSVIDLSATNNQAGSLKATALAAGAGSVDLRGSILGGSSGYYDAGGTLVPFKAGSVDIRAQHLGDGSLSDDFAALNQRLNQGQVFGARSFQLKQGDLLIGDGLKAGAIDVSVDGGTLTVNGTVDASGERVGSIRLAGKQGLTIGGHALLDAHGTRLRVDSYGKIIDSPNRAVVELGSGDGLLTLADGARIDLRHGTAATSGHDGKARGTLELNAPRLGGATAGDIAIDASGNLDIQGAKLIAVNGVQRYDDAIEITDPVNGHKYQQIDQDYLNQKHTDSLAFIDNALANGALVNGKLAGLNNSAYADAFHLRPGVEIVSKTADGDLVVQGDLDLSGYRYASLNPHTQKLNGVYGTGEVGNLVIRAGGDLSVYGSVNDGFMPPPETTDDDGWVLTPGKQLFNGDVVVPRGGIELQDGTTYLSGVALNFDLPLQAVTLAAGTRLPVAGELTAGISLPAGTVLAGDILNPDHTVAHAAGTRLSADLVLAPGMILGSGSLLLGDTALTGLIWPKGVALPSRPANTITVSNPSTVAQLGALILPLGALIPAGTDVKLAAGVEKINLRGGDGKGRNWAVAQMLAEGTQSWSLRAVAGADLQAADTRMVDPYAERGELRVADTHYGFLATPKPGQPSGGGRVLTVEGSMIFYGDETHAGKPVSEVALEFQTDEAGVCAWESLCMATGRVLTAEGSMIFYGDETHAGKPVAEVALEFQTDEAGVCAWESLCEGGGDEGPIEYDYALGTSRFSVLRVGTGDLDLISAGDFKMQSLYGIYTAGTSSLDLAASAAFNQPRSLSQISGRTTLDTTVLGKNGGSYESLVDGGASSLYRAWYPDHGGNLLLSVGGDLTGDILGSKLMGSGGLDQPESSSVSSWLWRQGGGINGEVPTAWWINFGTYMSFNDNVAFTGFTGFGTLGGGNLDVRVGGDAGMLAARGTLDNTIATRSQGLVLAVGSTGRMVGGELVLTGGGDLDLKVGGGLNPALEARAMVDDRGRPIAQRHDLNGSLANLRGAVRAGAGSFGGIEQVNGPMQMLQDPRESRAYDPFKATMASATGGLILVPGDATISLDARGDLVLGAASDAGRTQARNWQPVDLDGGKSIGRSWFSLWTDHTAIDLFSAGGNLTPSTQVGEFSVGFNDSVRGGLDFSATDGRFVYPSILRAAAPGGSLYYGPSALWTDNSLNTTYYSLLLAPGSRAQLEFLAGDSIYAGGYAVTPSNAPVSSLATPFNPAFYYLDSRGANQGDLSGVGSLGRSLFAFGGTGASSAYRGADEPARFYALNGDIIGLRTGELITFASAPRAGETWYEASRPARIMAGRDIVNSGQLTGTLLPQFAGLATSTGNLFIHDDPTDISIVSAGRDILYSTFNVAGPGTLEISAGRNILMEDKAAVTSLGAIVPGDNRPGADIVMQAGIGAGPDYLAFAQRYLDPANRVEVGGSLAGGGVAKTYEVELAAWLAERFGFSGSGEEARAYYAALPAEQQRVFAREIYFAELRAGGREYNDAESPRFGSYLRGRNAIAALFPTHDVAGNPILYQGDITMYGGAGVHTNFGGSIQMLTPGGQQVFGIEGEAPPSTAGVITQGAGDIQLFANGSVLLGQSRIMTTFGGDILAWSAAGDINAGRGSKTTLVYTPPRRVYDNWGNVTMSPTVPSTGAGIATLAPIAEVPPGDIDLLAPLGTIDAGEAGIRVSGNVNIAALQVVNAANIQVQGKSNGIPVVAAVNTGALSSASSAASSASDAAEGVARDQQAASRQRQPSIFTVQVLGFGNERVAPSGEGAGRTPTYDSGSSVQVLGAGQLDDQARNQLTTEEQRNLTL
ncbi:MULTISPECIES: filamentous haemagglutinin family protein [unclassified Pseudomonas]|uniref:filamentous haemagglutinin family protein n=1 Tax=unclassified Pseudomonas TaxID=196821 RepID=UPI000DA9BCDC|nr:MULTISPECIES: filamentous haemagglutinin family protein [unclassified Pseudomonas]MDW3715734.1 filamentous hemagglutinin family protein [Pseudomonas sp. 2023EL-01195]PZE11698.1 hemagglutinin [Pseudomonas sp. 57B-090624]